VTIPASRPPSFAVRGPIRRADLRGLSERVCAQLDSCAADLVLCDVAGVPADAVTVDALARLQLGASRHGCRVQLANASTELRELVAFMGLADVLTE
jgi:ABC-type transporter Mla MlaB component